MTNAAASPDWIAPWDLDERIVTAQRVVMNLIDAGNWVWAHKALGRVDRLFNRRTRAENPVVTDGYDVLRGMNTTSVFQRARAPRRPPRDVIENMHAQVIELLAKANARRRAQGERLFTLRQFVEDLGPDVGPDFVADMLEVEARLNPTPSG
jgi:hypothetical protein